MKLFQKITFCILFLDFSHDLWVSFGKGTCRRVLVSELEGSKGQHVVFFTFLSFGAKTLEQGCTLPGIMIFDGKLRFTRKK